MLPATRYALALAASLCLAPSASPAVAQDAQPASPPVDTATGTSARPDVETPASDTPTEAEEDKRICRNVRLDPSSRRKTKVCRTVEEWRELNNPR